MKKLNPTLKKLVQLLSDGEFHSGTSLGETLGISRNAVWKQLQQLSDNGIPVESIKNTGHRLAHPLVFIDSRKIKKQLTDETLSIIESIDLFTSIDSTNNYLKTLKSAPLNKLRICLAETQEAGKGRLGRKWFSPFGTNIYLSCGWHASLDVSELSGLGLVIMMAIADSLKEVAQIEDLKIKWPNDILWHEKKIAGCLIETLAESYSSTWVVIGFGINVNIPAKDLPSGINATSLTSVSGKYFDRNQLIASILNRLLQFLNQFKDQQFKSFLDHWQEYDFLLGKTILLNRADKKWQGKMLGVDQTGHLLLQDTEGNITLHSSGDTSILSFN